MALDSNSGPTQQPPPNSRFDGSWAALLVMGFFVGIVVLFLWKGVAVVGVSFRDLRTGNGGEWIWLVAVCALIGFPGLSAGLLVLLIPKFKGAPYLLDPPVKPGGIRATHALSFLWLAPLLGWTLMSLVFSLQLLRRCQGGGEDFAATIPWPVWLIPASGAVSAAAAWRRWKRERGWRPWTFYPAAPIQSGLPFSGVIETVDPLPPRGEYLLELCWLSQRSERRSAKVIWKTTQNGRLEGIHTPGPSSRFHFRFDETESMPFPPGGGCEKYSWSLVFKALVRGESSGQHFSGDLLPARPDPETAKGWISARPPVIT